MFRIVVIATLFISFYTLLPKISEPPYPIKKVSIKKTNNIHKKSTSYKAMKRKYKWLDYNLYSLIKIEVRKQRLGVRFVLSVIQAESQGYRKARGKWVMIPIKGKKVRTRALGLMQIIPEWHYPKKSKKHLFNPKLNIKLGVRYLRYCKNVAKGNLVKTLKNYNAGPGSRHYNWPYIKKIVANL